MKVLALNKNGSLTYCTVPPEDRGKGRCDHVLHRELGQSTDDFIKQVEEYKLKENMIDKESNENIEEQKVPKKKEISQKEINNLRDKIEKIAGCEVTENNLFEVLSKLSPEKINQIAKIGFDNAPEFSIPINDDHYNEENAKNKIYFADLPEYGIGGKSSAIKAMFDKVGTIETDHGYVDIEGNYKQGLTPHEYFQLQFSARKAAVAKSIGVAKPGYTARLLFYSMSDDQVYDDCGGDHEHGILGCNCKNGICVKCAEHDHLHVKTGDMIGAMVSTNLSEPLTQLALKQIHSSGSEGMDERQVIANTFNAYSNSPIIQKEMTGKTTMERRQLLFNGLKEDYAKNGIAIDDYNIAIIAKKLTSYKREKGVGLRAVHDNECCDIVSIGSIGNAGNPFKAAALGSGYKNLVKPYNKDLNRDSVNDLLGL
jgi:hypothetical protein